MTNIIAPFDTSVEEYIESASGKQNYPWSKMTPFHCECRAFGRLKDLGSEGRAVKTHGYIKLNLASTQRQKLSELLRITPDSLEKIRNPDPLVTYLKKPTVAPRLMGIVKDWVEPTLVEVNGKLELPLYQTDRCNMLLDLQMLKSFGVIVRHLHPRQYVAGVLVSLSYAWTIPQPHEYLAAYASPLDLQRMANADTRVIETRLNSYWDHAEARQRHAEKRRRRDHVAASQIATRSRCSGRKSEPGAPY
jgi:hypothetical protein